MFILRRKFNEMQSLINASRKALADAEMKISERNKLLKDKIEENKKLKARITDLENNVEFLYNNLSAKKKALVRPDNQD